MTDFSQKTALVTGANSGLGFEAAAQLAQQGYGRVILACRTLEKAEGARKALADRVGRDPFVALAVDVSSIDSANAAVTALIANGTPVDTLLLNAGVVPGNEVRRTSDGFEESFAASIVGHHILANRLIEAGLVPDGARIVIAGSEAANGDLPKMMDAELYDFATGEGTDFGPDLHSAMVNYARAQDPSLFSPMRYYAVAKTFVAWWAASMHRRYGERIQVFTVSPGASMSTNAARHQTGFKKFLFTKAMPLLGGMLGMDQPMDVAAKRYVDVLLARGDFESGRTYTSAPKKMVGPIQAMKHPHLLDERRQETAWSVLAELTGTAGASLPAARASA